MELRFVKVDHPWQFDPLSDEPLGFLSVAATARELSGVNVSFSDMAIDSPKGSLESFVEQIPQSDAFLLTASTLEFPGIVRAAEMLKKKYPSSKILAGGPHFDCMDRQYLVKEIDNLPFDVISQGEGEANIKKVLEAGPKTVVTQTPPYIDINSIPLPARDLLDSTKYFGQGKTFAGGSSEETLKQQRSATINVSRGCPNQCSFCASPYLHNRTVRFRSLHLVEQEMTQLKEEYGISSLRWHDDNFQLNLIRQKGLVELMQEMGFTSRVSARTDYIAKHPEVLSHYFNAGIREIGYGIETADENILRSLNKETTVENHRRALIETKKAGIRTRVFLITGLPWEDQYSADRAISLLEETQPDVVTLMNFVPMPGSDIYRNPQNYGVTILTHDWGTYNIGITREFQKFPFVHTISTLSREGMVKNLERLKEYIFTKGISNVPIYNKPYTAQLA